MSTLFGTDELLFSDDTFTDWDGVVLAKVKRPRWNWRSMFTSPGDLEVVRADGLSLFTMPELDGEDVDELRVTTTDEIPPALVRKKRGLSILNLGFTVLDGNGTTLGTIETNHAWDSLAATLLSGLPVAAAEVSGRSWTLSLKPEGSATWNVVLLAMVIAADEMQNRLSGMG
ncbi:hypothetical protein [Actinomadura formosensis]|uniref:hypothetical protein n=1 Tax=Actinomadura formosensis TaxID=60706 RepID=UPI00082A23EA|nr:hypothetical protein [Actinomadura formosensis]